MGFLKRVFGGQEPDSEAAPSGQPFSAYTVVGGPEPLEVVGESFYQGALLSLVGSTTKRVRLPVTAILMADVDNQYDPNAVSIWVSRLKVGHLSREDAATFRPRLLELQSRLGTAIALPGVVVGGGEGRPSLGVFLNYDPVAFGLAGTRPMSPQPSGNRTAPRIRTGLSNAVAADHGDDTYDLGWQGRIPPDRLKAVSFVRQELIVEQAPISRHFLYAQLEDLLYGARDEFSSALAEYDDACEAHHQEMPVLRPALIEIFGGVPLLETYKQASIRHQKAHAWEAALRWADLGIEVYGAEALAPEFVDDLARRAAGYRVHLAPPIAKSAQGSPRSRPRSSLVETLTCASCGTSFERLHTRGRKPTGCPECRGVGIESTPRREMDAASAQDGPPRPDREE